MRQTATAALISDFFTTEPAACDPCSLPRCPPSKIMDIRLQEERAQRLRGTGKTEAAEVRKVHPRDRAVRAIPAPEANALLQADLDRWRRLLQAHVDTKGKSKQLPPHQDETLCFPSASPDQAGPSFWSTEAAAAVRVPDPETRIEMQ